MSHRVVIVSSIAPIFQEPEVREKLSAQQLTKVDAICNQSNPCDEDFRYLARRLTQAYCTED